MSTFNTEIFHSYMAEVARHAACRHSNVIWVNEGFVALLREEYDRRSRQPNAPAHMVNDRIARDAEIAMYEFSQKRVAVAA